MPQKPKTANDIIVNAFHMIGEFSPDEIPSASEITKGLELLNEILDSFSSLGVYIPFIQRVTFTMTPGEGFYIFSTSPNVQADVISDNIVGLNFVNVIRNNTSYPLRIISRSQLYDSSFQQNLKSRPSYVILERSNEFSGLQFYPLPDFAYECEVRGKFVFDRVDLYSNLEGIPRNYFRFLRYCLARELLEYYPSGNWSQRAEMTYQRMMNDAKASNDVDMTIVPGQILQKRYGDIVYDNFGTST
jgi:hypothetical protein